MLQKFKKMFLKKTLKPLIILDVGCRWGFADKFIDDVENILVYGFDPDVEECERLDRFYHNENIRLVPIGLSDLPGKRKLFLTNEPACSSLYQPDAMLTENYPALNCAKEMSTIDVDVSTLDIWAESVGINYVDYIKIDTQGSELAILKGGEKVLQSVRFLEIEVEFNPIYKGQPIFSDVDFFLRKHGFVLWKFSNIVHYAQKGESDITMKKDTINYDHYRFEHEVRGGQLYWADAFYVRKEIVETKYDNTALEQSRRDSELARRLGFMDLTYRIDQARENQ